MSVRGRVRSPHISGGRPAAGSQCADCLGSCATQPACYSLQAGTDRRTDRGIAKCPSHGAEHINQRCLICPQQATQRPLEIRATFHFQSTMECRAAKVTATSELIVFFGFCLYFMQFRLFGSTAAERWLTPASVSLQAHFHSTLKTFRFRKSFPRSRLLVQD